jgi:SAM-dependent methyltransferase
MCFDPAAIRAFELAAWQRAASGYASTFAFATRPFIQPLLNATGIRPRDRLLDIACGPGFLTAAAAGRGAIATGLDFSPAMLEVARGFHPTPTFDQGDAEALPYADAGFHAVVSNCGIHHVPQPVAALREAWRVMCLDGRVAFTIWAPREENIAWRLLYEAVARHGDIAASRAPPPAGGLKTKEQCLDALDAAGFVRPAAWVERAVWHHRNGAALLAALRTGTARMAALIDAQPPEVLPRIAADIDDHAEIYRDRKGLAIPIAAIIATASKL